MVVLGGRAVSYERGTLVVDPGLLVVERGGVLFLVKGCRNGSGPTTPQCRKMALEILT